MEPYQIAIIVIAVIIVIGIIAVALVAARKKAKDKTDSETAGKVNVIDGVRYTESDKISSDGEINVTHNESDVILKKGKTFKAEKTVLSCRGNTPCFLLPTERTALISVPADS